MTLRQETQTSIETAGTIHSAFEAAIAETRAMTADPEFHDVCLSQGIDPYDDMDKPPYWEAFAGFAYDKVQSERVDGTTNPQLEAREILAETPRYLIAQARLREDEHGNHRGDPFDKQVASYYHGLLKRFATNHPAARLSTVKSGIEHMVQISIEDPGIQRIAAREATTRLQGVRHELAFGQILGYTGHQFRETSVDEDLMGLDYVLDTGLGIDVKSSTRLMPSRKGKIQPYKCTGQGQVIMPSFCRDQDFGDHFFIPEPLAVQKAPIMKMALEQAERAAA